MKIEAKTRANNTLFKAVAGRAVITWQCTDDVEG